MKKAEKPFFVANLGQVLASAEAIVLINYSGLSVKMQQELKKRLKSVNASLIMVKNTLFKLAGQKAKITPSVLDQAVIAGPTALVIGEKDPIAPLHILAEFAREFEVPQFKAGVIEGVFNDPDSLSLLSQFKGKDILLQQTIRTIASPLYRLVSFLEENIQQLIYIFKTQNNKQKLTG